MGVHSGARLRQVFSIEVDPTGKGFDDQGGREPSAVVAWWVGYISWQGPAMLGLGVMIMVHNIVEPKVFGDTVGS